MDELPRHIKPQNTAGKYVLQHKNPCALCGWPKEYAIHCFPAGTPCKQPFYAHDFTPKEQTS
jgi:hypothetical protein